MHFHQWKRRELITLLGSAATLPLAAQAQQPTLPVVGVVSARPAEGAVRQADAFRKCRLLGGKADMLQTGLTRRE